MCCGMLQGVADSLCSYGWRILAGIGLQGWVGAGGVCCSELCVSFVYEFTIICVSDMCVSDMCVSHTVH